MQRILITLGLCLAFAQSLFAAQTVEFPCFQGLTVDMRLVAAGTNTIVHTTASLTGRSNDPTQFAATDVPNSLAGVHRVSVIENGTTTVKFSGFVLLTGTDGAVAYADPWYASVNTWGLSPRTLTMTAAEIQAVLSGSAIRWKRGDDVSVSLTGLGDLTGWAKLQFTAKKSKTNPDSASEVQLELVQSTGVTSLLVIGGAAPGTGETGTITIDNLVSGSITISLNAKASAKLGKISRGYYDVQRIDGSGNVKTVTEGSFLPSRDVTRAVE